jgi:hypothetical protein
MLDRILLVKLHTDHDRERVLVEHRVRGRVVRDPEAHGPILPPGSLL